MNKTEFVSIRKELQKTQKDISKILCVSEKAIQSFEQGWRNIPTSIEREMMLLYSLAKTSEGNREPTACWEVVECPDEWREKCLVGQLKVKHFCWYINGTFCQGEYRQDWGEKIKICRECQVFKSMFLIK